MTKKWSIWWFGCALAYGAVAPSVAHARAQRDFDYRFDQVWNAVVRMLRVDYRFPIEERDDTHGFVLFTYREYGRTHAASLEAIRVPTEATGDERVRMVVHIEGMPTHAEAAVLDHLEQKLRAEYGSPVRRPVVSQRGVDPRMPRVSDRNPDGGVADPSGGDSSSSSVRDAGTPPIPDEGNSDVDGTLESMPRGRAGRRR